jgi:hypothetical protein
MPPETVAKILAFDEPITLTVEVEQFCSCPSLAYAADFLNMLKGGDGKVIDTEVAAALDTLLSGNWSIIL